MLFDLQAARNHAQPSLPTAFDVPALQFNRYAAQVAEKAANKLTSGAYEDFMEGLEVLESPSSLLVDKVVAGLVVVLSFGLMVGTVRAAFSD
jgi:hypothetical protein